MSMYQKYIPIAAFILWAVSLALPGIIFKPTLDDNPKYGFCASALKDGVKCILTKDGTTCTDASCYAQSNGHQCGLDPIHQVADAMNQNDVNAYCGQDWNEPRSEIMRGYQVLFWGWLGILMGNLAWCGNPLVLISMHLARRERYRGAFYCALTAFLFGISAFSLFRVPRNEGGVNDYIVDSLGIGYYVWMVTILSLCVYTFIQLKRHLDRVADLLKTIGIITAVILWTTGPLYFYSVAHEKSTIAEEAARELTKETRQQKYEQQSSDENLLNPFFRVLTEGNYRVTVEESLVTSYFEKGKLVRVGESTEKNPSKHYDIIKNGKVYTIYSAQKMFTETDIKSDAGEVTFKKMQSASVIGTLQNLESEFRGYIDWQYGKDSQVMMDKGTKIEATFDPETNLLLSVYLKSDETKEGKLFHLKYQKISDEEIEQAKQFPLDYTKVDSIR